MRSYIKARDVSIVIIGFLIFIELWIPFWRLIAWLGGKMYG